MQCMWRVTAAGFIAAKVNMNQVIFRIYMLPNELDSKNKGGENQ